MSYSVMVVRREVQVRFAGDGAAFQDALERRQPLTPFTAANRQLIEERLSLLGFEPQATGSFHHAEWTANAMLQADVLYLTASGDGVFEIGMIGSELVDEELAKFDPQANEWE